LYVKFLYLCIQDLHVRLYGRITCTYHVLEVWPIDNDDMCVLRKCHEALLDFGDLLIDDLIPNEALYEDIIYVWLDGNLEPLECYDHFLACQEILRNLHLIDLVCLRSHEHDLGDEQLYGREWPHESLLEIHHEVFGLGEYAFDFLLQRAIDCLHVLFNR
jgi:hypothetical protein